MIRVLAIGNSFSEDAMRYLHDLAKYNSVEIKCVNLYIGGCSLQTHAENIINDAKAYDFQINSASRGLKVSIKEALLSDEWNYITIQQASHFSFDYDTYMPYLQQVADFVRNIRPDAKIFIHRTWMYEEGSVLLKNVKLGSSDEMYNLLSNSYNNAAAEINADGVIPSGDAMYIAMKQGFRIHRDTFHAGLGFGRFLIASIWLKTLSGVITKEGFNDFDEPVTEEEYSAVIDIVNEIFK